MLAGLAVNGLAAYVFLSAAGRTLGPKRFGAISVLWAAVFLIGGGLFQPFEQELGRAISAHRARNLGYQAMVRRTAGIALLFFAPLSLIAAVFARPIASQLFREETTYVFAGLVGIAGVGFMLCIRGVLAGSGRYHAFGLAFAVDGLTKAGPALLLLYIGTHNSIYFAAIIAVSGFFGGAAALLGRPALGDQGEAPPWRQLSGSLGFLLLATLSSQLLLNIGTIAVEVLASEAEHDRAGVFLSGLVIARIPLFLFQAGQAVILPRLSRLVASNKLEEFAALMKQLLAALLGATLVASTISAAVGPTVVRTLFGQAFSSLTTRDMSLLTLSSMLMMTGLTINQAQIALGQHHHTGWPWLAGTAAFVGTTAIASSDLILRVELGMLTGSATVILSTGLLLAEAFTQLKESSNSQ